MSIIIQKIKSWNHVSTNTRVFKVQFSPILPISFYLEIGVANINIYKFIFSISVFNNLKYILYSLSFKKAVLWLSNFWIRTYMIRMTPIYTSLLLY